MKLNERLKRTEANEKAASPSARRIGGQEALSYRRAGRGLNYGDSLIHR